MPNRTIVAPEFRLAAEQLKLSPGLVSGNNVFLTGVTGADAQGVMPADCEVQIRAVFEKITDVLRLAGLDFAAIVEMTSYHIDLDGHFDLFQTIRAEYVHAPYPAWTAVEVAGLRREGAIVEVRVIAAMDHDAQS